MSLGERSIAEEVIRFAEHAMHQNWIGRDRLKISFLGNVQAHRLDRLEVGCDLQYLLVRGRCSWHLVLARPAMPVMAGCSQVALGWHREDREWHPRAISNNQIVEIEQKQDNDGRDDE